MLTLSHLLASFLRCLQNKLFHTIIWNLLRMSERVSERVERAKKYRRKERRHTQRRMPWRRKKLSASFFFFLPWRLSCLLHITTISKKAHIYREWARDSSCAAAAAVACMAYSVFHKNSWMIDVCRSRWMRNFLLAALTLSPLGRKFSL